MEEIPSQTSQKGYENNKKTFTTIVSGLRHGYNNTQKERNIMDAKIFNKLEKEQKPKIQGRGPRHQSPYELTSTSKSYNQLRKNEA